LFHKKKKRGGKGKEGKRGENSAAIRHRLRLPELNSLIGNDPVGEKGKGKGKRGGKSRGGAIYAYY